MRQARGERATASVIGDHADLGEAAIECRGAAYVLGQRLAARGQCQRVVERRQCAPVERGALVERGREVVAKGRAERHLEAGLDLDDIDERRPHGGIVGGEKLAERLHLRREPARQPLRALQRLAASGLLGLRARARVLGRVGS